jgi:hypothetical protein
VRSGVVTSRTFGRTGHGLRLTGRRIAPYERMDEPAQHVVVQRDGALTLGHVEALAVADNAVSRPDFAPRDHEARWVATPGVVASEPLDFRQARWAEIPGVVASGPTANAVLNDLLFHVPEEQVGC